MPDDDLEPELPPDRQPRPAARPAPPQELPRPDRIMAIIRFLAEHTEKVIIGDHAHERMLERGFTTDDVYRGLRLGEISGRITPGKASGEFKCKVVAQLRGSRKMGVAVIVVTNDYLFVKTVEWEDR